MGGVFETVTANADAIEEMNGVNGPFLAINNDMQEMKTDIKLTAFYAGGGAGGASLSFAGIIWFCRQKGHCGGTPPKEDEKTADPTDIRVDGENGQPGNEGQVDLRHRQRSSDISSDPTTVSDPT